MTIDRCLADYCPTCGQPRETEAPVERFGLTLTGYWLAYGDQRKKLRPALARFARVFLEHGEAHHERLVLVSSPDTLCDQVKVYAFMFRNLLDGLTGGAVNLQTVHSWGYELVEAEAERRAA